MKVLVVLSSLYTGGAEYSTLLLYQWCRKNGHDVRLVCYKNASPHYDASAFDFEDVITLSGNSFLRKLKELNAIIDFFKPDIIHSVLFEANVLARFSRLTHLKTVYLESLVNETYSPFRLLDPKVKGYKLKGYQYFDAFTQLFGTSHFHANSQSVAKHYKVKLLISDRKITIIPRGRNENPHTGNQIVREEMRKSLGIGQNTILFINAGRHEFQKGQDILIEAIARVKGNLFPFQVIIAGREGNMTSDLNKKIIQYNLHDKIKFLGHRSDLGQLLAASDVFVFPSRFEGLPGVLIEAEAAALPVVVSDIPNNREVAIEGRNAFYFSLDDPQELSELITRLVNEPGLRKKLGTESLQIFKERFSLTEVHQRMEALLLKLIEEK